jgi:hypothetical protein
MKKTLVDFYSKKYYEAEVKFRELKLDLEKKELLLSEAQDRISKLEQTPALSIVMSALLDLEDLKFIQKELHEAYEMNDKILIGYAINRLDTLIFEETQQLQKGNIPNVMGSFEPTDEQIRKASYEWCESEYGNIEPHSTEGSLRRKYFKSAIKWYIVHKKIIGENVR